MNIWVIKDGEILPIQSGSRLMRTGMLADELSSRGHSVTWWASTFSHQMKSMLYHKDTVLTPNEKLSLRLLMSGGYRGNVSVKRLIHHKRLGRRFKKEIANHPAPDIIVAAFPTIEIAYEAVMYAKSRSIPIIVDIRDLWPDTFLERSPKFLKPIGRYLLWREIAMTKKTISGATALFAISEGCLNWGTRYTKREKGFHDRVFYTGYPSRGTSPRLSERVAKLRDELTGRFIVVFIGSFGYSYELDLVCEAAKALQDEMCGKIRFVLAGDGERFDQISKLAQETKNVILTGWLDSTEVHSLLTIADAGLVPCKSVPDAMPNKLFEYLSAGLPVLSSLEGEAARLIEAYQIGFSYPCGDKMALADSVRSLLVDDGLRNKMSVKCRELFHSQFASELVYKEYADHVEEIAEKVALSNETIV